MKLKVAIFGGSGYGGSELLRILLSHPNAEIGIVTANEQLGKAVSEVHRNLLGLTDLKFTKAPEVLRAMGLTRLQKSEEALAQLAAKGMSTSLNR